MWATNLMMRSSDGAAGRGGRVSTAARRRRDEVEIKGTSGRVLWEELLQALDECELTGEDRGVRLEAFSKSAVRAYLPIRDISRWAGLPLPRNWAQIAEEPMNWTELFEQEAKGIQPAPKRVTSLLKSYRYARTNFGAAVGAQAALGYVEDRHAGYGDFEATSRMYSTVIADFVGDANEDKVQEFFADYPKPIRDELQIVWEWIKQRMASDVEVRRDDDLDMGKVSKPRM